jgi:branched-chain amino acid transport system permease protein
LSLLQILLSGIAAGCVYALVALSFVLIYKSTDAVSFMQGELMMSGAFAALAAGSFLALPWWLGLAFALGVTALAGAGIERLVIRRAAGQAHMAVVMLTLGLGMMLRGLVGMVPAWSSQTHALPLPVTGVWRAGGLAVSVEQLTVAGLTAAFCLGFWLFYRHTRTGLALRACAENPSAAALMGVAVPRMHTLVWALAAAMAAFAGILLAPITFVHAGMGLIALKSFAAAVLGGMASLPGTLAGGLLVGVVEAAAGYALPEGFKEAAVWLLLLAVMFWRPGGLAAGRGLGR